MKSKFAGVAAILLLAFSGATAASAETYPDKPIRFIVPWPAGGGTDAVARILAERLSGPLGQQVVVENRGGAGTVIGNEAIAASTPDGYTYGMPTSSLAVTPFLYDNIPYNVPDSFDLMAQVGIGVYVLVVNAETPATNVKELIDLIKTSPDKVHAGFNGHGSPPHLALTLFESRLGTKLTSVNYRGTGPAVTALLSGEIQMMFTTLAGVMPHLNTGNLRILATPSQRRATSIPDVPTTEEAGLPDFYVAEWYGISAPHGTPRERRDLIVAEVQKTLADEQLQQRLQGMGVEVDFKGSEAFQAFVASEMEKWGAVIKEGDIKVE